MKPTMRDIAKFANVSLSTVSRAMTGRGYVSDETYALILEVCRKHGYDTEQKAKRPEEQSRLIGILTADLHNEFNVYVIDGVTEIATAHGYEVIIYDAKENRYREERGLKLFLSLPLAAIAFTPVMCEHAIEPELLARLERMNLPIVLMDRDLEFSKFDAVFVDNVTGACDAIDAFAKCGHRKIATITGTETSKTGAERIAGYKKGLYLNNLPIVPEYIQSGEFTTHGGYLAMKRLMEFTERPTAVFVANSVM
ncbi:MAG: LacI family DNA-binding transcriptional regulator, partial [Clostridia bacterium]